MIGKRDNIIGNSILFDGGLFSSIVVFIINEDII